MRHASVSDGVFMRFLDADVDHPVYALCVQATARIGGKRINVSAVKVNPR